MKTKTKKRIGAQIVESLQEFLTELQNGADLSDFKCRVVEVNAPASPSDAELARNTRALLRASQTVFAKFLGVPPLMVRAWEKGEDVPTDTAKRFMDEIRHDPAYWRSRLREVVVKKKPVTTS